MSPQNIKSPSSQPKDFKSRVISCLNKLSDRDTLAVGAAELESIALTLTSGSFSPFLACIYSTDDSSKSSVRRHCVQILAFLSHSHGDALSPHVAKMAAIIVRRLRDSESSVRDACVASSASIAAKVTRLPFSVLLKPLSEALTTEQDANSQMCAAMCVAAAVEAAPESDHEQLRRLLSRAGKLLRSEVFKGKAAVLGMMGSIVGCGAVVNKGILEWVIPLIIEFLSSEDWPARKAAAETLGRVAATERELAEEHKESCLKCLEARRFDKVKVVRETMNRSLDLWKDVGNASEDLSASPCSSSSSPSHDVVNGFLSYPKSSHDVHPKSSDSKKLVPSSISSPSDTSPGAITNKESPQRTKTENLYSPFSSGSEQEQSSSRKIEGRTQSRVLEWSESESESNSSPVAKRSLFGKSTDDNVPRIGAFRSGSLVVPLGYSEKLELESGSSVTEISGEEDHDDGENEMMDLALVLEQLAQIKDQQFCLFELLQKFMGNSQSGMNSLESRVQGLEMALEGISFDLGLSKERILNCDSPDKTCCKLPGANFLSSKLWGKAEGRYSTSRLSSPRSARTGNEAPRLREFPMKREVIDYSIMKSRRVLPDFDRVQFINPSGLAGTSLPAPVAAGSLTSRSSS
ncbi:hypothetical protein SAY87_015776 [Trapa incisa]|uniref:TORTIFOLIA1/SINE1-2 N-terminal domain-containing protein n=1 Tax=Trapa incisa TaxID=236973 RepID=A0AAN7L788_9MYRT|nr:hypothetical protein SAY87_015776 [Trapa incisa]